MSFYVPLRKRTLHMEADSTRSADHPLQQARTISPLIRREAPASERLGRLSDATAAAMLDANLFSIMLPSADGGHGGSLVDLFETVEEIARADGSAGWCAAVCNGINAFVSKGLSADARGEILGDGPVAGWATLLPKGASERTDRYRVSGAFAWGSGSSFARWVMVQAMLESRDECNGSARICYQSKMSISKRVRGT